MTTKYYVGAPSRIAEHLSHAGPLERMYIPSPEANPDQPDEDTRETTRQLALGGQLQFNASKTVAGTAGAALGSDVLGGNLTAFSDGVTKFDTSIGNLSGVLDRFAKWADGKISDGGSYTSILRNPPATPTLPSPWQIRPSDPDINPVRK